METTAPTQEELESLASAAMELMKQAPVVGIVDPRPVILLIGAKSSAKSSAVQRIVGFPMNYTAHRRATTRPLKVICQKDPECQNPVIVLTDKRKTSKYKGVTIQEKEVMGIIGELMKEVERFSDEEIVLEITWKNAYNICFIDLPGYESNSPDSKDIEGLLIDVYQRYPNCFILHLMTANTDSGNDTPYRFIREKLKGWKNKTQTVITKFDDLCRENSVPTYDEVEDMVNYFQKESGFPPYFMCSLHQYKHQPISNLRGEEQYKAQCNLLEGDKAYEQSVFDIFTDTRSDEGASKMGKYFGFAKLLDHLVEIQVAQICDLLPLIYQKLTEDKDSCLTEVHALEKRLAWGDPVQIRNRLLKIANKFIEKLEIISKGDAAAWATCSDYTMDLETELKLIRGQGSNEMKSDYRDISDHNLQLLGGAQVIRAMREFVRDGISHISEAPIPRSRISSAMGSASQTVGMPSRLHGLTGLVCSECERIVPAAVERTIAHLASIVSCCWSPAAYLLALQECGAIDEELGAVLENCFEDWFKRKFDEHLIMARTNIKICSEPKLKNFHGSLWMMISNCEDKTAAVPQVPQVTAATVPQVPQGTLDTVLRGAEVLSKAVGDPRAVALVKGIAFVLGASNRENIKNYMEEMRKPHPLLACVGSVTNTDAALDEVGKQAMSCIRSMSNLILISMEADLQYWVIDSFLKSIRDGLLEFTDDGTERVMSTVASENEAITLNIARKNERKAEYEKSLQICTKLMGKFKRMKSSGKFREKKSSPEQSAVEAETADAARKTEVPTKKVQTAKRKQRVAHQSSSSTE